MNQKYWYFGIRKKVSTVGATGNMRSEMRVLWAPQVFDSAVLAAEACTKAMATRPGVSFFIQGFDQKLSIRKDGTSAGFIQEGK